MGEYALNLGPLLIGVFLNTYLCGVMMFQCSSYMNTKYRDPAWIKAMVAGLFTLDTFHTVVAIHMTWEYCVKNYANPEILEHALWSYNLTPIITGIAALVGQLFLGHRTYRLAKTKVVYGAIVVFAVASCVLGIVAGAWGILRHLSMMNLLNTDDQTYRLLLGIWLAVLAAGNIMIAGSLTHSLTRCDPHFLPDNTPFARVLRGFLQTGLVIALFSIITLVCFFSSPSTNVIGLLALPFGRLYSNAVLDTLLSRIPYSARSTNAEILITKSGTDSIWLPTGSTGTGRGAGGLNSGGGAGGAGTNSNNNFHLRSIHVKTEVYSDANNDQDGPASDEDESKSGRRGMGI